MTKDNWSHAAAVFAVRDMEVSVGFYTKLLSFNLEFSWGEPVSYAVLKRADINLHLTLKEDDSTPSKTHNRLYIFVYDIQNAYAELIAAGVKTMGKPVKHDYGMTDFDLIDPDGHIMTLGSSQ